MNGPIGKVNGGTGGGRLMRHSRKKWTCVKGHQNPHWRTFCLECREEAANS